MLDRRHRCLAALVAGLGPRAVEGLLEVVPLPGLTPMAADLVLVYPTSGQTAKKVTAFRDFAVQSMRQVLR